MAAGNAALGSLVVSLGLDAAEFTRGLTKSEYEGRRAMQRLKQDAEDMGKAFALASVAAGVGAVAFARNVINAAADLDDMAEKTGASVEELSKLTQQAHISGTAIETVELTLIQLSKHLQGAGEDSKNTGRALAALGLNASNLKNLDTAEALKVIAGELNKFADGSGKSAWAMDLLGKAGAQALPFLKDMANDQALAANVTAKQAAEAEELGKSWRRLTLEAKNVGQAMALDIVPYLQRLIEQFREGKEIAGGFWEALRLFSGLNPFRTTGESVANLQKTLDSFRDTRKELSGRGVDTASIDQEIAAFEKKLKFAQLLQRQDALALSGGDTAGELQRFGLRGSKQTLDYKAIDDGSKAAKEAERILEKFRSKLAQVQEEIRKSEGIDSPFIAMKSLLATDKDFQGLSESRKTELLDAAELLGITKALRQEEKEREEGLAQVAQEAAAWKSKDIADAVTLRDRLLDLIDPLRAIRRENEEIDKLVATGWMTDAQAKLAKLDPEIRSLLQSQSTNIFDKIQKAWEAGNLELDEMNRLLLDLQPKLEKTDDFAKELGLTFTSAFEDAITSGKKFSDVLKSLAVDIAKMFFRKQVTTPLANAIGGSGGLFSSILNSLGLGSAPLVSEMVPGQFSLANPAYGARGLAFDNGMIPFASGGIVDSPTRFRFSSGATMRHGLMGEAGPEAIMPLKRINGRLGVESSGEGGTVINVAPVINVDSRTDATVVRAEVQRGVQQAVAMIPGMVRRGGNYKRAIRG